MNGQTLKHVFSIGLTFAALTAAPVFAQEWKAEDPHGYVSAFGGAVWSGGNSTGSVLFEGGARVVPHVMLFTNFGRFADLGADLQPSLDSTTAGLSDQGIGISATGTLPAWYGIGGVRAEIPARKHAIPYFLGGLGAARLTPSTELAFSGGTLPDGSTPDPGTDVTTTLVAAGTYSALPASTAFMYMLGGGLQVPLVPHWAVDLGYRYSRIAADSTLSARPLNTNTMTFGFGYRF